jgi:hypothetical protein
MMPYRALVNRKVVPRSLQIWFRVSSLGPSTNRVVECHHLEAFERAAFLGVGVTAPAMAVAGVAALGVTSGP